MINYNNRYFKMLESTTEGETDTEVIFHYRQEGNVVWGTFYRGTVQMGTLLAKVDETGNLDLRFQFINEKGDFVTGKSDSRLTIREDGRYKLDEFFQVFKDDGSVFDGFSMVEEVR